MSACHIHRLMARKGKCKRVLIKFLKVKMFLLYLFNGDWFNQPSCSCKQQKTVLEGFLQGEDVSGIGHINPDIFQNCSYFLEYSFNVQIHVINSIKFQMSSVYDFISHSSFNPEDPEALKILQRRLVVGTQWKEQRHLAAQQKQARACVQQFMHTINVDIYVRSYCHAE